MMIKDNDVNNLIIGNKDFEDIEIEKPEIISPSEFIDIYLGIRNTY